jgi:7-cyano-7-deazaguanine synthase in queuosine biosynthesis
MNIVLLSGGLDSAIILHELTMQYKETLCLFIDYGQPSKEIELKSAQHLVEKYNSILKTVKIPAIALEDVVVYKGRNLYLITLAIMQSNKGDSIYIGVNESDYTCFPDCRRSFILPLRDSIYNGYGVFLEFPLINRDKLYLTKKIKEYNLQNLSWCYKPTSEGLPCHVCLSCLSHEGNL